MKTFLRLLTFLADSRWRVVLAIFLGCVMIASNMILLGMAAYLIAAAALGPLLISLTLPIYIVRFMSVTRAGSRYAERVVSHNVTFRLLARLRVWAYSRLEPLAPSHLLTYRSGDVLTRLVSDVEELQNVYLRIVAPLFVAIAIVLLTFGLFTIFSPILAWVALAFLVATGIGVSLLAAALSRGSGKQQLTVRSELNMQVVDGIQGIQDLLAFGRAKDQQGKLAKLDGKLGRIQRRMAYISGLQLALNDGLMNLALWALLILSIPLVTSGAINGVYLGFLALVILASFEAIQPLAQAFQFLGHSLAAGERVFKLADTTPLITEPATPLRSVDIHSSAGSTLEFEHVHFAYQPDEREVLSEINFSVAPGSQVAIVGPSGSGKSTLVKLALRFWDPTSGTVLLNGHDVRKYALADLRNLIGVVAQDTYLFNDTIRGNLLLARPEASDSEITHALEQAQLTNFVDQLPQGLETWVGEHGLRLSGGERQRLAIARALLKNAPLLILDEATANLDPVTEAALLEALAKLMRGRTTLMITHRLTALEQMDTILVLAHGKISEQGTHDQLMQAEGLYRQMFDLQNGELSLA
ncbi:MAG TPA: thiol reductant ABC exporter subunit CydC [Ktedonobacteraceae bacterium]|nr:thiol reductant ABC exporter subunit CydC [Ktedonobacteraceae bacterium]